VSAVDEAALERRLAALRAAAASDAAGMFGPRSMMWRVDREAATFLGAGRALLLQLAHPWVAAAIAQHSRTLADPIGRFHRTFGIVFTLVFGTAAQATAAARRLHRRHAAITGHLPEAAGRFAAGSPYRANDQAALAWVHATLIETAVMAHDLVLPPLGAREIEQYYAEARRFAGCFGIAEEMVPQHWSEFAAYCAAMQAGDTLAVSAAARGIAEAIFAGAGPVPAVPHWYRALTARLLPERLRDGFGLAYGEGERQSAERALAWISRAYPLLPRRLRFVGPYQEAERRLAGRPPGLLTEIANRVWIGQPRMR